MCVGFHITSARHYSMGPERLERKITARELLISYCVQRRERTDAHGRYVSRRNFVFKWKQKMMHNANLWCDDDESSPVFLFDFPGSEYCMIEIFSRDKRNYKFYSLFSIAPRFICGLPAAADYSAPMVEDNLLQQQKLYNSRNCYITPPTVRVDFIFCLVSLVL